MEAHDDTSPQRADQTGQYGHKNRRRFLHRRLAVGHNFIAIDTLIAEELLEILNRSHVEARAQRKRDAERFRRELAALEPQEDQLTDLLVAGSIDDVGYKRQRDRIREQRDELARKLEQAGERVDDVHLETVRSTIELAKRASSLRRERSGLESGASIRQSLFPRML